MQKKKGHGRVFQGNIVDLWLKASKIWKQQIKIALGSSSSYSALCGINWNKMEVYLMQKVITTSIFIFNEDKINETNIFSTYPKAFSCLFVITSIIRTKWIISPFIHKRS